MALNLVWVGDSITEAYHMDPAGSYGMTYGGEGQDKGYAQVTTAWLESNNADLWGTITNKALGGTTAVQWGGWVASKVEPYTPDVVCVMLGINDCVQRYYYSAETFAQYQAGMRALMDDLVALTPQPRIFLITPPRADDSKTTYGATNAHMAEYVSFYTTLVGEYERTSIIDVNANVSLTAGTDYCPPDGIHPDASGNAKMATYVEQQLAGAVMEAEEGDNHITLRWADLATGEDAWYVERRVVS